MRIIKVHGRSVVEEATNEKERRIIPNALAREGTSKPEKPEKPENVEIFFINDPNAFIAQWASMLDKMLKKPSGNDKEPTVATRVARTEASIAFQKFWYDNKTKKGVPKQITSKDFKDKWELKVHSYDEKDDDGDNKDKPAGKGRWYKVFAGDVDVIECEWNEVAKKIYQHLYEKQYERNPIEDRPTYQKGLITKRSNSIAKNTRSYEERNSIFSALSDNEQRHINSLSNGTPDWGKVKKEYQLKELANALKKAEDKEKDGRLLRRDAITCHYEHYARIFPDNDPERKALPLVKAKEKTELWQYHNMIKEALFQRCPKHPVKNKKDPQPFNESRLHHLAINIEANRQMAFAIRLGKVIHYQGELKAADPEKQNDIISSYYWTSKGQTEIKQNESFVRQWMGAIAVANSTLTRLLDPENKVKGDLLVGHYDEETTEDSDKTQNYFNLVLQNLDDPLAKHQFNQQFKLLFGENHNLYDTDEERNKFIIDLRETLAQLRHTSFHFKSIEDFNKQLDGLIKTNETTEIIESHIANHQKKQRNALIKNLETGGVRNYLEQAQYNKLRNIVINNERHLFTLPKFNKLLDRDNKTVNKLIVPIHDKEMEDPKYKCSYTSLKLLYEYDFGRWLADSSATGNKVSEWIDIAKNRVEVINHNEKFIQAKVSRLRAIKKNETFVQYLSFLSEQTAIEFQVQENTYDSNQKGAQEQSNFVENFKQDIIIQGFHAYLQQEELKGLNKLCKPSGLLIPARKAEERKIINNEIPKVERPWLYMVLHLMPIEALNHIALQIRKHHVLTQKEGYKKINQAVSLYLDIGKSVLELKQLEGQDELDVFYESPQLFKEKFTASDNETLMPVRGLRELLRYGNLKQLDLLFATEKISQQQFRDFEGYSKDIVNAQTKRKKLRENFEAGEKPTSDELVKSRNELSTISKYRELKNHIYLNNHKQVHQLIMQILGRLAGFSQLWERDLYFTMLALFLLRQVNPDDYTSNTEFIKFVKNGQITKAHECMQKEGENKEKRSQIKKDLREVFIDSKNQPPNKTIRNNLAHLNALREDKVINLTELINQTRELTSYDRKIKNSVSRSMIELLERNNLLISFKIESTKGKHKLKLGELNPKIIYHLGTNETGIAETLHSQIYLNVIKKLFKPAS